MRLLHSPSAEHHAQMRQLHNHHFNVPHGNSRFIFAPYRICPLGAHVDHQLGMVSAIATEMGICVYYSERDDGRFVIRSEGFPGEACFDLSADQERAYDWTDYARGALRALKAKHRINRGLSISVSGEVTEAGLSSSAAIGLSYLTALADINGIALSPEALIELDREIENGFLGLKNGVLDQSAILYSKAGCLTVLDCATGHVGNHPVKGDFVFLAVFSGIRQALVASNQFNQRVEESLRAGAEIRNLITNEKNIAIPIGRSSYTEFRRVQSQLDPISQRRARHFYSECARVKNGRSAWQLDDAAAFGKLMIASCESSIHQYETGSTEMIALYKAMINAPGVYGARLSGAGFRGCVVALIDPQFKADLLAAVDCEYGSLFPEHRASLWAFETRPADGLNMT
ncbi:MAG: hypothetical protein HOL98_04530 [Gammaproteobacteria bacterium]|jgi:galactokinase|nr:hypothetical protein [Gammaproteobacteria bacterium]MBT5202702.1 hypothetical protein [Gammaproteobacteria bacterium]MBT5602490.1 hypothetical protein [Gammaproteobacteria bacterium]MBT6247166.1 hypothetical protein [Gammaproteobacteria bacterium]